VTYTISSQERTGELHRVALKRAKTTKDDAMKAAWKFSLDTLICDVVVTRGSKHVATYRDGKITELNGKEHKP
jgi:hypothetical protein